MTITPTNEQSQLSRLAVSAETLGEKFESTLNQLSAVAVEGYNQELSHAELGLRAVAEALGDVAMYERSYQISRPEPNGLQKENIVKFCLEQKDAASALKWLAGEWQGRFSDRQKKLVDRAYVMSGRGDDLLQLRREAYQIEPSFERLQALLEASPEAERDELKMDAVNQACSSTNIVVAVATLMKLQDMVAAAAYVLRYPEKIQNVNYYAQAEWAETFEAHGSLLAAVPLYRELLLDILEAGRTKAYRHAAKYYKALERLDSALGSYQPLMSKSEFDDKLKAKHSKKRSFWSLVS